MFTFSSDQQINTINNSTKNRSFFASFYSAGNVSQLDYIVLTTGWPVQDELWWIWKEAVMV